MQSAARAGRYPGGSGSGSGAGYGDGNAEFQNLEPNFSTEGPIILSDTRGVDFGPYLARIVYIVRRNWYSVIPESARLGEKGRVGIVFEILKDGTVPQLRLVASSGSDPLDRAALAGIHASIPFPPLPEEFTGNHLVLQFIFLYNLTGTVRRHYTSIRRLRIPDDCYPSNAPPQGTRTTFLHRDASLLASPVSASFSTFESTRIVRKLMSHDLLLPAHSPRSSPNLLNWWVVLSLRCNVSPPHRWLSGTPNPAPKPGARAAAGEAPKPI